MLRSACAGVRADAVRPGRGVPLVAARGGGRGRQGRRLLTIAVQRPHGRALLLHLGCRPPLRQSCPTPPGTRRHAAPAWRHVHARRGAVCSHPSLTNPEHHSHTVNLDSRVNVHVLLRFCPDLFSREWECCYLHCPVFFSFCQPYMLVF